MAVCPFDPATQQMPFKALLDRVFKTRFGTWIAINVGQRIDPYLMRATRGHIRISFTAPTILLTHMGAKSGKRRTTPLLYFTQGDKVVLIASKGGAPQHPAWYHNVKAHPEVEVHGRSARALHRTRGRGPRTRPSVDAGDQALLRLRGLQGAGDQSAHPGDRARTGQSLMGSSRRNAVPRMPSDTSPILPE
jgi:deazaflavin-dependent oxidoreductase (nitroreductase family)